MREGCEGRAGPIACFDVDRFELLKCRRKSAPKIWSCKLRFEARLFRERWGSSRETYSNGFINKMLEYWIFKRVTCVSTDRK
jgi:hypothetical protein